MHILLSTDKNYIMPSAVMMKSVSVNNIGENITFHVLIDNGVTDLQKQQLQRIVEHHPNHVVSFHLIEGDLFKDFPQLGKVKKYITQATYYRLFITDFLPDNVHKILYLDGDIVVHSSLRSLWDINLKGYAIGSVTDMAEAKHDYGRLGYAKQNGYFNAGVLLINLDYWREYQMKTKFLELIVNEPEKIVLHDQDVLNITLNDQKLNLPMKYNAQSGYFHYRKYSELGDRYDEYWPELKEAITDPVIIHYADKIKPWHVEDSHPYGYEFMKYYKQTEWRHDKLCECGSNKTRHYVGKLLRLLHIIAAPRLGAEKYYTLEEIMALRTSK